MNEIARVPVTPAYFGIHALDSARGRVFRTAATRGVLEVVDLERHAVTDTRDLGFGVDYLYFDAPSDQLLVTNYATGEISVRAAADLSERRRFFVGHRSRTITADPERSDLWLTSVAGAFVIDRRALGH